MAYKTTETRAMKKPAELGLLAMGAAGNWEVAVHQTIAGPEKLSIQIEGPSVSFLLPIPSPDLVENAIRFFSQARPETGRSNSNGRKSRTLILGKDKRERPLSCKTMSIWIGSF
jgi:hypothetical protein